MKELKELLNKRFSVYVNGEFECYTDFLGIMKRLNNFSDFFDSYSKIQQKKEIKKWLNSGEIYVDNQINISFPVDATSVTEDEDVN